MLFNQVLQKDNEGFAVAFFGGLVDDIIGGLTPDMKEMTPLWLTRGRNSLPATVLHPTGPQERQSA